jgi:hypothetical protein
MFTASVFWRRLNVLKSGTVQFSPISRNRLSTNPVVCLRATEQNLHRQAGLDGWIAEDRLPPRLPVGSA